ncbi:hypothetical protein J0H33_02865 [bacterium]|nr:hypothetical protein [bacterium]
MDVVVPESDAIVCAHPSASPVRGIPGFRIHDGQVVSGKELSVVANETFVQRILDDGLDGVLVEAVSADRFARAVASDNHPFSGAIAKAVRFVRDERR